jgi:hypothetical protein
MVCTSFWSVWRALESAEFVELLEEPVPLSHEPFDEPVELSSLELVVLPFALAVVPVELVELPVELVELPVELVESPDALVESW